MPIKLRAAAPFSCARGHLIAPHSPSPVSTPLSSQKHQRNKLDDMNASLGSLEFSSQNPDAERVFYYEFEPRVDDCPLLLCAPHNLRIEAMVQAEKDAERAAEEARQAKLASMKKN